MAGDSAPGRFFKRWFDPAQKNDLVFTTTEKPDHGINSLSIVSFQWYRNVSPLNTAIPRLAASGTTIPCKDIVPRINRIAFLRKSSSLSVKIRLEFGSSDGRILRNMTHYLLLVR